MTKTTSQRKSESVRRDFAVAINVWPMVGLILGIVLAVAGLTMRAAWWADDREARATADHVGPVMESLQQSLGVAVTDYAWWDDAFEALHVAKSKDWAVENLSEGSVIGADRTVDGVLVVASDGAILHALWRGQAITGDRAASIHGGVQELVSRAREAAKERPVPVFANFSLEGDVAMVAASAVMPTTAELASNAPSGKAVVVFMRTLTPEFTQRIGDLYKLPQLRLALGSLGEGTYPLKGADGSILGGLEWSPVRPGTELVQSIWLDTLLAVVVLAAIGMFVLRQFLAQRRTLLHQVTVIDEGSAQLNDSLAKLSNAMQAVDYGIAVYDRNGRLSQWNDAYEKLWSLPPGMAKQGAKATDILDYCVHRLGYDLQETDDFGAPVSDPYALGRSGRWVWRCGDGRILLARRLPLPDGGYLAVGSDTTQQAAHEQELVAAKEQAVMANRSKSEFLANVSHELRTPLNAIIGFSEILLRELFGPLGNDRYKSYVADIHSSGEHLLSLINDILDLSKIESGRFKLRLEVFDCVELAQTVARLIRPRAQENTQELTLNVPKSPLPLNADKRALKQVLINLLANAVKFTPEGGKIVLRCAAKEGGVEFSVTDTGIGIEEKDIETALAPFGQIDSQYSRRHEGTGLGLTIVNGIVSLHRGTLKVASRVGEGTKVTFFVPDQGGTAEGGDRPSREYMQRVAAS